MALTLALIATSSIAGYVIYRRRKQIEAEDIETELDDETLIETEVKDLEFETEESR